MLLVSLEGCFGNLIIIPIFSQNFKILPSRTAPEAPEKKAKFRGLSNIPVQFVRSVMKSLRHTYWLSRREVQCLHGPYSSYGL